MLGRSRFAKLVRTQLDLFEAGHRDLLDDAAERMAAYNRADRSEAEELYGDYVDAIDAGVDELEAMRDRYASTVEDPAGYVQEFNRAVARRFPDHAAELERR